MRVLVISPQFPPLGHIGGAEVSAYHTCKGLQAQGVPCSVLVVNNRCSSAMDERYSYEAIPVHRLCFSTHRRTRWGDVFDHRIYRAVKREIRRVRPDIVHIHNASGSSLAPYLAAYGEHVPVVNTLHDLWLLCPNNMLYRSDGTFCDPGHRPRGCRDCFRRYDFWGDVPYRRALFAALTSGVKLFVSPSQAVIDRHVEAGYAPERFRLVRLGFAPQAADVPTHWGVQSVLQAEGPRYPTLVFAGGGIVIKGAEVLLDALPDLIQGVEQLRVVIVGGGEGRLLDRFRTYSPVVDVLGKVPFTDMRTLLGNADLTLVPSVCHENSPVVIYESYQMGTPVVGSRFGGIPELIQERQTGYLHLKGDSAGLTKAVVAHFARPPHERREMRQACYRAVTTHLSLASHIEAMMGVYAEAQQQCGCFT